MLSLPADLYDPGDYSLAGGTPLYIYRSATETLSGQTQYSSGTFSLTRGGVTYSNVPPNTILVVEEAWNFFVRQSGSGIVDAVGWALFTGSTLQQMLKFAGDLTALSASSSRTIAANNPYLAELFSIRNVVLFPGQTLAWYLQTASDVTVWNTQQFVRGWLLPRGNLNIA